MKLFLTSKTISYSQGHDFIELVGKDNPRDIKIALIENAVDTYAEDRKAWVYDNRTDIQAHGFQIDLVDLNDYRSGEPGLLQRLEDCDAIWLGGGNTYYLRWILRESGADRLIQGLAARGKVIGGGSAGAIVAGPTLKHFELADDPADAPEIIYKGLGLIDTVVVPHWANEKYGEVMQTAEMNLQKEGFETIHITDDQALVIDGESERII